MKPMSLVVLTMLLALSMPFSADAGAESKSQLEAAYGAYVAQHRSQEFTFGNDADVGGKMFDLVKTFVDKTSVSSATWQRIKGGIVNGVDLWNAETSGGATPADVNRFLAKTVLPYLEPDELRALNLSEETVKWLVTNGANVSEPIGQAAGTAAGGGPWQKIGEELTLGGIDAFCPQCAVARRAVLVAYEGGKLVEGWVQDQAVAAEFERWDALGDMLEIGTLSGHGQLYDAAAAALKRINGEKPSRAEVDAFILDTFKQWQAARRQKEDDARILEEAMGLFSGLDSYDRRKFGTTPAEQAEAWAKAYLEIFRELQAVKAQGCSEMFPVDQMQKEAEYLARKRQTQSVLEYRRIYTKRMHAYGCTDPAAPLSAEAEADRRAHIRARLFDLDYARLATVLDHMGVKVPKAFFECLCEGANYNSSSAVSYFSPEPYGKCDRAGPPCIVAGEGCTRHPLMNPKNTASQNAQILDACLSAAPMTNGVRLDAYLSQQLRP